MAGVRRQLAEKWVGQDKVARARAHTHTHTARHSAKGVG